MSEMDQFDFSGSMGAEVAKESNKGGTFAREVEYLSLDGSAAGVAQGKNQILVRFLTDVQRRHADQPVTKFNLPWITVAGHYTRTKPRPDYAREGAQWPEKMNAGCRADKVFAKGYPSGCMFCQRGEKPSSRTWALAVEREEVRNEQNQILGYQDKTREVFARDEKGDLIVIGKKSDGKDEYQMKTVPAIVVMNMGWKNFFGPLQASAQYFNSLLDGDWVITRSGTKSDDTTYTFIRVAEQTLPENNPFGLPAGTKYDLSIPGLMDAVYPDMPDLRKIIADRVSEDYLGRWFVPGWTPPNHQQQGGQQQVVQQGVVQQTTTTNATFMAPGQPAQQQAAPAVPNTGATEEPPTGALDALRARVTQGASQ